MINISIYIVLILRRFSYTHQPNWNGSTNRTIFLIRNDKQQSIYLTQHNSIVAGFGRFFCCCFQTAKETEHIHSHAEKKKYGKSIGKFGNCSCSCSYSVRLNVCGIVCLCVNKYTKLQRIHMTQCYSYLLNDWSFFSGCCYYCAIIFYKVELITRGRQT